RRARTLPDRSPSGSRGAAGSPTRVRRPTERPKRSRSSAPTTPARPGRTTSGMGQIYPGALRPKPDSGSARAGGLAIAGGEQAPPRWFMLLRSSILRPRGRSVVLASALALGLTGAHACLPTADCTRSRSCPPSGGAVGIIEHWTGGSAGRGGGEGGGAGAPFGGLGGLGGFGGGGEEHPQEPPLVAVGDECEPDGLYSCADHATREQLVCDSGYFVSYDRCPRGQLCDTRPETQGLCQPIIPECDGHEPGDIVCRQSERIVCGADLVTAE